MKKKTTNRLHLYKRYSTQGFLRKCFSSAIYTYECVSICMYICMWAFVCVCVTVFVNISHMVSCDDLGMPVAPSFNAPEAPEGTLSQCPSPCPNSLCLSRAASPLRFLRPLGAPRVDFLLSFSSCLEQHTELLNGFT